MKHVYDLRKMVMVMTTYYLFVVMDAGQILVELVGVKEFLLDLDVDRYIKCL